MVTLLPDPLVNVSGIDALFDKSIVTGWGVKLTGGRDMTTSDGDDGSMFGLISSAEKRKKNVIRDVA